MPEALEIKYDQAAITPFWRKLPFIFLFPFRFGPLVVLACLVGASAIAGLALGPFGLVFRGLLVYFGLRYAFNILELFAKGRFEGESVDHRLWGPEKRPAKLGLVLALFVVIAANLGQVGLETRLAQDTRAQDQLIARYQKDHAEEIAQRERDRAAFNKRIGLDTAQPAPAAAEGAAPDAEEADSEPAEPPPDSGPSRAEIVEMYKPGLSDPLWFQLQPLWFWIVVVLLSLLLPAAAVVIALEDSFFKSLNPLNAITLIQAMGSAYFVLWGFFLLIAGARHLAFTMGEHWPAVVRLPVEMAAVTYLGFVLFALMGYALYQFHQQLHLEVEVDFDEHRAVGGAEAIAAAGSARAARQEAPVDPLERKLQPLIAAGNFREAIAEVKDAMRYDRLDPKLNTRLHQLLVQQGDPAAILAHGQVWLTALARAGQGKDTVGALRELRALDPAFQVQEGDVILPAATAAVQMRDFPLAALLLRSFDKRFPKHKDTPAVFFLGARLLSEQNRQHEKAAQILRAVLAHFPQHEVADEARTYLAVIEGLMRRAAAAAR